MTEKSEPRRLYRSREHRVVGGVLGGVGEYLNVDPVALRVLYVVFAVMTGVLPFIFAYMVLCLVIPEKK